MVTRPVQGPYIIYQQCAFGCRGVSDHIAHYINCVRLLAQVDEAMDYNGIDSVRQRLLLHSPTAGHARALAVAFSTYHTVNIGKITKVHAAVENDDYYADVLYLAYDAARARGIKVDARRTPGLAH